MKELRRLIRELEREISKYEAFRKKYCISGLLVSQRKQLTNHRFYDIVKSGNRRR